MATKMKQEISNARGMVQSAPKPTSKKAPAKPLSSPLVMGNAKSATKAKVTMPVAKQVHMSMPNPLGSLGSNIGKTSSAKSSPKFANVNKVSGVHIIDMTKKKLTSSEVTSELKRKIASGEKITNEANRAQYEALKKKK